MNKTLTPEQRATLRADCDRAVAGAMTLPVRHVAALLDAADERDRLAADLDALCQRAEQMATLPHPLPDAAALHVVALYAVLATPEGARFHTAVTDILGVDPAVATTRAGIAAVEMMRLWNTRDDPGVIEAAAHKTLADLGRRILAGEG